MSEPSGVVDMIKRNGHVRLRAESADEQQWSIGVDDVQEWLVWVQDCKSQNGCIFEIADSLAGSDVVILIGVYVWLFMGVDFFAACCFLFEYDTGVLPAAGGEEAGQAAHAVARPLCQCEIR